MTALPVNIGPTSIRERCVVDGQKQTIAAAVPSR